ncbi:MAG TPA: flagellar biosynthesis protein FlhB [Rhodospirillaceae bacterium]|jgi:flagellar biosynthetic protein FlhB|nr:flagellar biosynthesis protein FlhB [Alphaproteobacteria bacterium]HBH26162.1 flagellar biosynthesis protein FlhB [Rhodospirillaceae bacterium]
MAEGGGEQPDESQKTEDPTPRRLEQAREKGQVPVSREVSTWLLLFVGTLLIAFGAGPLLTHIALTLRGYLEHAHALPLTALAAGLSAIGVALLLPALVLMAVAFAGPFLQVGPLFSTEPITPKLSKVSLVSGLQRLFSGRALFEFFKGIVKISAVSAAAFLALQPFVPGLPHMVGMPAGDLLAEVFFLLMRMLAVVLVVLLVLAVADLLFVRFTHHQKMRMSRQEVRDELKQSEGDPLIRARLRALRAERAKKRMMANVPKSDVVITNPTHYAVALRYDPAEMEAPVCVAKGVDAVALRIRAVAAEAGVEVVESPALARTLYTVVEVDEVIPPEQYRAVAEVISYVFKRRGRGM